MGALAALATLALVGTGAAGAFAATTIPQSGATSEDATPAVSMLADGADTPAVITEEPADEVPTEDATPVTPADPALAPAPTPEVTTPTDTTAPTPTETSKPAGEVSTTTDQLQTDATTDETGVQSLEAKVMPTTVPTDETGRRYLWEVRDTSGNLVEGATFSLEGERSGWWPVSWGTPRTIADCFVSGGGACDSYDRDNEGGVLAVVSGRGGFSSIGNSARYRLHPASPPPGYGWVVSTGWTEQKGTGNSGTWSGSGDNATYNFGTFQVQKVATQPSCLPGYVYGIQDYSAQIVQVDPDGTVTNVGGTRPNTDYSTFNGLGIGKDGKSVFAYARSGNTASDSNVRIFKYNPTDGIWTDTGVSVNSGGTGMGGTVTFVAGAVNLENGMYYLGGYSGSGDNRVFRLYEYNPTNSAVRYVGRVSTPGSGSDNGDIAFNSSGDLFIVRGSDSTTTVYSVTKANLAAANGGIITSSPSQSVSNTTSGVNGIAFDADGYGYLSNGTTVQKYGMPGWTAKQDVSTSLGDSTDLASCGSPPTITIQKEVIGGRNSATDQFKLELSRNNKFTPTLGVATTEGNDTGIQAQQIGPQPTVRGVQLYFRETGSGTTNLANYASGYQCTLTFADGSDPQTLDSVPGTSGSIRIPANGDSVTCVFRNSPLTGSVDITKMVTDVNGENAAPATGWEVTSNITAAAGSTVTNISPNNVAQQTAGAEGKASWTFRFGAANHTATVGVSESMKPGFEFQSGSCDVTHIDGSTTSTTLDGAANQNLEGIEPGDSVACTYVNKPAPGTLAIEKVFDKSVPPLPGTDVEFTGKYTCTLADKTVASGTWSREGEGDATLIPAAGTPAVNQIPAGASCSATEHQPTGSEGLPNSSYEWDTYSVDGPVTIAANQTGTITVTNKAKRVYGNFSVKKLVPAGSVVAKDMEFSGNWRCELDEDIVEGEWGPIAADETWTSDDAEDEIPLGANCTVVGENREDYPAAGYVWDGAPIIGAPVTAGAPDPQVITVTNKTKAIVGPDLPLTGGQSAAMFTILGGGLLAGALALTAMNRRKGGAAHRA